MPARFNDMVQQALADTKTNTAHATVRSSSAAAGTLPPMIPDLCIVNFYTAGVGRLGVHQVCHPLCSHPFILPEPLVHSHLRLIGS